MVALGDIVLDATVSGALREWLASNDHPIAAFATAPTGTGLTTLVRLLVRDVRLEPVWMTASEASIEERLNEAGGTRLAANGRRKIIVMDDFDSTAADKRTVSVVTAYAKDPRMKTKVLCLGHPTRSSKASEFAAQWARFAFPKVDDPHVARVLRTAGADEATAHRIASECRGDVRAALAAFDLATKTTPTVEVHFKDVVMDGLDSVERVLGKDPLTVRDLLKIYDTDATIVPMGVYENYTATLSKHETDVAARVAEAFSVADVVNTRMHETQSWDLWGVHGVLSTAAPGLELRRRHGAKVPRVEKFGSVWSKAYNARAKAKNAAAINFSRATLGLDRMPITDMAFHRLMVAEAVNYGTDADVRAACDPLGEKNVLSMMRLGVGSGSAYKHARVKRLLT